MYLSDRRVINWEVSASWYHLWKLKHSAFCIQISRWRKPRIR